MRASIRLRKRRLKKTASVRRPHRHYSVIRGHIVGRKKSNKRGAKRRKRPVARPQAADRSPREIKNVGGQTRRATRRTAKEKGGVPTAAIATTVPLVADALKVATIAAAAHVMPKVATEMPRLVAKAYDALRTTLKPYIDSVFEPSPIETNLHTFVKRYDNEYACEIHESNPDGFININAGNSPKGQFTEHRFRYNPEHCTDHFDNILLRINGDRGGTSLTDQDRKILLALFTPRKPIEQPSFLTKPIDTEIISKAFKQLEEKGRIKPFPLPGLRGNDGIHSDAGDITDVIRKDLGVPAEYNWILQKAGSQTCASFLKEEEALLQSRHLAGIHTHTGKVVLVHNNPGEFGKHVPAGIVYPVYDNRFIPENEKEWRALRLLLLNNGVDKDAPAVKVFDYLKDVSLGVPGSDAVPRHEQQTPRMMLISNLMSNPLTRPFFGPQVSIYPELATIMGHNLHHSSWGRASDGTNTYVGSFSDHERRA